ncbi:MAG: SDR family oxidoreductase, partial [Acidobacteriota bacterium]
AVAVNYLTREDKAKEVVDQIRAAGGRAIAFRADTRERDQVDDMATAIARNLGPADILVINANISFPMGPFLEYRWEDFEAKLMGELRSAFHCCKAFVPPMLERKRGSIVAVSSNLSRRPGGGFCAHSTAKSGLDALMKSLADELGPRGIRVNVVSPGLTITDATAHMPQQGKDFMARMTPLQRNAVPDDIAGAIAFLASDEARFITGQYLPVSGGILML